MCLAIPARVVSLDTATDSAVVNLEGVEKTVSTALLEQVKTGDYVLVHVGFALNTIDPQEAEATLAMFASLSDASAP